MSTIPQTHRALIVDENKQGKLVTQNIPKYDDLLVQVKAVGLNPTDWKHLNGVLQLPEGASTGSDFAGVIVDVKAAGSSFKVGDRVAGFTRGGAVQFDNGAFADYISAQSPIVWKIPDTFSFEQAVALGGIPGDTAALALFTHLDIPRPFNQAQHQNTAVKKGDSILIWSGAASVSFIAIQLAAQVGLVVYTTASPKHHEYLKSLGASYVYDYKDPDVAEKIYKQSNGQIKVALDGISEFGSTDIILKAISKDGGHVRILLPSNKQAEYDSTNSKVALTMVYTVLDINNKVDQADIAEWHQNLPAQLESNKLKIHKFDVRSGGLENIHLGLDDLRNFRVSGQRLVYNV